MQASSRSVSSSTATSSLAPDPAARGRVQASDYVQPTLPGVEEPQAKPAGFAMFTNPNR